MKQHTTEHLLTRESSRVLHTKLNNKQNQDQTKGVFYHNTVSFSFTCSTNSAEQGRLLFPPFLKPEYKKNYIFMSRVYETKKAFSRRRSEHTDRNVKLKPTVLFRTTQLIRDRHYMVLPQTFPWRISTMQSFKSYLKAVYNYSK